MAASCFALGCASDPSLVRVPGEAATSGRTDGGVAPEAADGGAAMPDGGAATPDGGRSPPNPDSEEICDGIDNDADGITDNRDVERDGVCDCLAIAYLGSASAHGSGDLFDDWLGQRSDVPVKSLATITSDELAKYDVLVVRNLGLFGTAYSAAQLDAIEQWVQAGGGLLTLTGYGNPFTEPANVNAILARFGLSYKSGLLLAAPTVKETIPVNTWMHPHPVTEGISKIGFNNGYAVAGNGTALASEQGNDVLIAKQVGKGHVLAWGDEWITFDSEWRSHPDYQVERLWQNMMKWLSATDVCQVEIILR